jgi:diadenosine tetraphosphate (Ap4A) HIT family hydrolase
MTRTWPVDWEERQRGASCHLCANLAALSFFGGRTSEALLERQAVAKGHAIVVFRGRHAASLTELSSDELAAYWHDVQDVARAIEDVFNPSHMNYLLLGNIAPHLHVHVVPRYLDDRAPERPLPWEPSDVPAEVFEEQLKRLRTAVLAATRERKTPICSKR